MQAIYVLIMLFGTGSLQGGPAVIQQEFTSYENCERARVELAKAHGKHAVTVDAQGCFKK